MSRLARKEARTTGGATVRICGKVVNLYLARIVYRCEECLGELELWNAGIICKVDHSHKGFVHQTEAAKIAEYKQQLTSVVEGAYEIKNGILVYKGDNSNGY